MLGGSWPATAFEEVALPSLSPAAVGRYGGESEEEMEDSEEELSEAESAAEWPPPLAEMILLRLGGSGC